MPHNSYGNLIHAESVSLLLLLLKQSVATFGIARVYSLQFKCTVYAANVGYSEKCSEQYTE